MSTYEGHWWISSSPNQPLIGRLRHREHGGLRLKVTSKHSSLRDGSLTAIIQPRDSEESNQPVIIHGQAMNGHCFTLYDGFVKRAQTGMSGLIQGELFFNRGLDGALVDRPEELRVSDVYARYHGLAAWLSINPFDIQQKFDSGYRVTVSHEKPQPLRFQIDDLRTLLIGWETKGPNRSIVQTEIKITSSPVIGIEYKESVLLNTALNDIGVFENLLTLLLSTPTAAYSIKFHSNEVKHKVGEKEYSVPLGFMASRLRLKDTLEDWTPHDVLFPFAKVQEQFEDIVTRWFNLQSDHAGTVIPYFSSLRAPAPFAEGRLFEYARTAESLYRNLHPDKRAFPDSEYDQIKKEMLSCVPEPRKNHIRDRLQRLNHPSFKDCLRGLLERFPSLAADIIGDVEAQNKFCNCVRDLRDAEAHQLDRDHELTGLDFVRISSKLRVLIDAWLLAQIGLPDEQINGAIRENRDYWFYASNKTWPWQEKPSTPSPLDAVSETKISLTSRSPSL